MKTQIIKPTYEFYSQLQQAYDWFNKTLFENALPSCLITVQREKNMLGFFSPLRWSNEGEKNVHEIALNPAYFANSKIVEVFQTLVHEQCHLWQHEFGRPSRSGYHNREWADKMESIGLMPSSTGRPGGDKTGQRMSDYLIETGQFKQACIELIESGHQFRWADRRIPRSDILNLSQHSVIPLSPEQDGSTLLQPLIPSPESLLSLPMATLIPHFEHHAEQQKAKSKTKYSCPICDINVWGKPNLHIRCEACSELFISI